MQKVIDGQEIPKVIFLDIDGVLNSRNFFSKFKTGIVSGNDIDFLNGQLDPAAIARLNRVIAETGAKVVISSTWRLMWTIEQIKEALEHHGFAGDVVGATDNFEREWGHVRRPRGLEIADFIERNSIEDFVVVDDDPICEDGACTDIVARLVRTTFDDGLTDEAVDKMIGVLNNE